jgi:hypothetical protein
MIQGHCFETIESFIRQSPDLMRHITTYNFPMQERSGYRKLLIDWLFRIRPNICFDCRSRSHTCLRGLAKKWPRFAKIVQLSRRKLKRSTEQVCLAVFLSFSVCVRVLSHFRVWESNLVFLRWRCVQAREEDSLRDVYVCILLILHVLCLHVYVRKIDKYRCGYAYI